MGTSDHSSSNGSTLLNRPGRFLGLILIWLCLALFTVWRGWHSYTLSSNSNIVDGKVVRFTQDSIAFYSDFSPIVEFQVDGVTYRVQSQNSYRWWSRNMLFPVGGQVEVHYEAG